MCEHLPLVVPSDDPNLQTVGFFFSFLLLLSRSVVSGCVRPNRRQFIRLPRPWDSPGKNTGLPLPSPMQESEK